MSESEHMDNFKFQFVGHQYGNLEAAIDLASARHGRIAGWKKDDDWLVFHWNIPNDSKIVPFPDVLDSSYIKDFVMGWLVKNTPSSKRPDIDGSVSEGYEILSDVTDGWSYESFRVRPIWAMHHK